MKAALGLLTGQQFNFTSDHQLMVMFSLIGKIGIQSIVRSYVIVTSSSQVK
jgi:heptaprenylglyceryl phosphate synthase